MNKLEKIDFSELEPADWDQFRTFGKTIVDDMVDFLSDIRDRPVWQPLTKEVIQALSGPIPHDVSTPETAYSEFCETILPFPRGNIHPRFWGWVNGSGVPVAVYAELLAAVMNGTVSSSESSAMAVEQQVISWMKEMFDWPEMGSGLLTSGCSTGQIIGLAAARNAKSNGRARDIGNTYGPQLTAYCSEESHLSVQKAIELMGIGNQFLRKIPTNDDLTINIDQLKEQIKSDRRDGHIPFCIVGNVGTVNTGVIDPIKELLSISQQEEMWLHLDGAFGAFAYLLPSHRDHLEAINQADSMVFDLHKWFYMPFDVSCILVKDPEILTQTFGVESSYTSKTVGGPGSYHMSFSDMGIEQSRPFRALKVWFALKTHGLSTFKAQMSENIDQIRHLNGLVDQSENLELVSKGTLNISCFRYIADGLSLDELNEMNRKILNYLQTNGIAVPSHTLIDGKFVLRVANNNHRSKFSDFDLLAEEVVKHGNELIQFRAA